MKYQRKDNRKKAVSAVLILIFGVCLFPAPFQVDTIIRADNNNFIVENDSICNSVDDILSCNYNDAFSIFISKLINPEENLFSALDIFPDFIILQIKLSISCTCQ